MGQTEQSDRLGAPEKLRKLLCELSDKYKFSAAEEMKLTQAIWANNKEIEAVRPAPVEASPDVPQAVHKWEDWAEDRCCSCGWGCGPDGKGKDIGEASIRNCRKKWEAHVAAVAASPSAGAQHLTGLYSVNEWCDICKGYSLEEHRHEK